MATILNRSGPCMKNALQWKGVNISTVYLSSVIKLKLCLEKWFGSYKKKLKKKAKKKERADELSKITKRYVKY